MYKLFLAKIQILVMWDRETQHHPYKSNVHLDSVWHFKIDTNESFCTMLISMMNPTWPILSFYYLATSLMTERNNSYLWWNVDHALSQIFFAISSLWTFAIRNAALFFLPLSISLSLSLFRSLSLILHKTQHNTFGLESIRFESCIVDAPSLFKAKCQNII